MEDNTKDGNQQVDIGYQYCQTSYENSFVDPHMQSHDQNFVPYLTVVQQPVYYPPSCQVYPPDEFSMTHGFPPNIPYSHVSNLENQPFVPSSQMHQPSKDAPTFEESGAENIPSIQHDGASQNISNHSSSNPTSDRYGASNTNPGDQKLNSTRYRGKNNQYNGGNSRGRNHYNNRQYHTNNHFGRGGGESSFKRNLKNHHAYSQNYIDDYESVYVPQQSFVSSRNLNNSQRQPNYSNDRRSNNYQQHRRGFHSNDAYQNMYPRNRQMNRQFYTHEGNSTRHNYKRESNIQPPKSRAKPEFSNAANIESNGDSYKDSQTFGKNSRMHEISKRNVDNKSPLCEDDEKFHKDKLVDLLTKGNYECMVCCEFIKQQHSIWSCSMCYHCFHLSCTKKWAQTSHQDQGWRCPACQNITSKVPNIYLCFCRKMRNPEWNRREIPHSCGEVCSKKRGPEWCNHKCNVLCHPGPCPPCSAFMTRMCPCKKSSKSVRCSQEDTFLCSKTCQKLLNCKKHTCDQTCHEGECQSCQRQLHKTCYCGKEEKILSCSEEELAEEYFSCKGTCGKKLNCDNHTCENICHNGPCDACDKAIDIVVTCPCTKALLSVLYEKDGIAPRTSCSDNIPTCGEICGKELRCGTPGSYHSCQSKCHEGPCAPCPLETDVRCRCGFKDCKVPCAELFVKADEVLCEKQCKKLRQCGHHKCGTKCCIDQDHTCPRVCGKTLKCRLHKCEEPCHRGNCPRCWQTSFDELSCHCGASVLFPPIPCGTEPLPCDQPCQRPHSCSHPIAHTCHSEDKCPPCTHLVSKPCFGDHVLMKITPCYVKAISCGEMCDKKLPCSNHKCPKVCHDGPCLDGKKCTQKCTKPRNLCEHNCANRCHKGPCPDTPCKVNVTVTCSCGNRKATLICSENEREYSAMATSKLASMMQHNMNSGASVDISQIFTGANKAEKFQRLECNDDCLLIARNQRLALALQISNPETREKLGDQAGLFSDNLKDDVKKDPQFCAMIHMALYELVMKAKDSKQKSRSHSFAPMNREKRRFIHEYAKHFGCQTQAYDEEPKKNVVVTATKGMCYLPPFSIVETVEKEKGNRKAPGPVLSRKANSKDEDLPQFQKLEKKSSTKQSAPVAPAFDYFDME